MADLKFRLQATEDNVASFLQILSTMQLDLSSDPTGITPGGEIDTELDDMLWQAAAWQKEAEHSDPPEHTRREESREQRGDDQPNKPATETWAEDLGAAWLGFSPGV